MNDVHRRCTDVHRRRTHMNDVHRLVASLTHSDGHVLPTCQVESWHETNCHADWEAQYVRSRSECDFIQHPPLLEVGETKSLQELEDT